MKITHLAITHNVESDSRILHKMAMSQSYGNEVTIITSGTSSKKIGKVKILSISKDRIKRKTYPIYAIKTIYYALQNKNSIYHVHEVPLMFFSTILLMFGKKVIIDFHEDFSAELKTKPYLRNYQKYLFQFGYKLFFKFIVPYFHHIILAEDSYSQNFASIKNKTIIRNYPKTEYFSFIEKKEDDTLNIVYAGTISVDRGCENILNVVAKLLDQGNYNIKLDYYGPIFESDLQKKIIKVCNKYSKNIRYPGFKYS